MKKNAIWFLSLPLIMMACNNKSGEKDSVKAADSTNEARMDQADSSGAYKVDEASADFLVNAANGGMTEVKMGELAGKKGVNPRVKEMGAMMVHDHTMANGEVKNLAAQLHVVLPDSISNDKEKACMALEAKSGKDFDKAFVKQMIDDHEAAISLFKKANDDAKDPSVKTFTSNTLPKLQMHLDSFKVVQKIIK